MRLTHTRQADLNLLVALAVLLEERQISTAADRFLNGANAPASRRDFAPEGCCVAHGVPLMRRGNPQDRKGKALRLCFAQHGADAPLCIATF